MSYDIDRGLVVFGLQHEGRKLYVLGTHYAVSNLFDDSGNNAVFFKLEPPVDEAGLKRHLALVAKGYFEGDLKFGGASSENIYKRVAKRIQSVYDRRDRFTLDISSVDRFSDLEQRILDAIRTKEVRGRIREETVVQPHFAGGVRAFVNSFFVNLKLADNDGSSTVAEAFNHWVVVNEKNRADPHQIRGVRYFDALVEQGERLGEWMEACKAEAKRYWKEDKETAAKFYGTSEQMSFLRQVFGLGEQKTPGIGRSLEETQALLRAHALLSRSQVGFELNLIINDAYAVAGRSAFENTDYMIPLATYLSSVIADAIQDRDEYPNEADFRLSFDKDGIWAGSHLGQVMLAEVPHSDAFINFLSHVISSGINVAAGDPKKEEMLTDLIVLDRKAILNGMSEEEYEERYLDIVHDGKSEIAVKEGPILDAFEIEKLNKALEGSDRDNAVLEPHSSTRGARL